MAFRFKIQQYYQLAKPGIVYGNLLTTIAGFLLAAHGHIRSSVFIATLLGTGLIIAAACAANNYIDRTADQQMARTRQRALVTGTIQPQHAVIYAVGLGVIGFIVLAWFVNIRTVIVGGIGVIDYVLLYAVAKRRSSYSTLVGSISGSMPIVAGYVGAVNRFDLGTLLVFIILTVWQMPHFYAIAIYRRSDYKAAHMPVLPVVKGITRTKIEIIIYIIIFIVACLLLRLYGYAGTSYAIGITILGVSWLFIGLKNYRKQADSVWARRMFFYSLGVITLFSVLLSLNSLLP
jgi:protoheme IX farnesyltransferase